jgi:4-hydroxy-3-polyprenylbenzoate decarboxylase
MKFIVAIGGASGVRYGLMLLKVLVGTRQEVSLVVTPGGAKVLEIEEGLSIDPAKPDPEVLVPGSSGLVTGYSIHDIAAPISSGTHQVAGMVVCPCSMGTLARVAGGDSSNLLERAADVMLKEHRKLVLVPRETPLSLVHLRNMTAVTEAGAIVLPAAPGFYHGPKNVDDLVAHVVQKILDQLGVKADMIQRWTGPKEKAPAGEAPAPPAG